MTLVVSDRTKCPHSGDRLLQVRFAQSPKEQSVWVLAYAQRRASTRENRDWGVR
ncbi:hypothetical protein [Scytonema sp. PRP1]|uniref:hypothetical protein n=1 Tax=Scytonema sp. PRP1 TaxID=3120513 RepID=UPI002FD2DC54